MLAMHGFLVAWASSDSSVLPAMPGSSSTIHSAETSSNEQRHEASRTLSACDLPTSSATSMQTLTVTPLATITESATEKAESQTSDPAGDATPLIPETLAPEPSSSSSPTSVTSTSPSVSVSATPHPTHHLPPGAVAGISIGAAAGAAVLVGLTAAAVPFRRRRRCARMSNDGVDVRVFDSASENHEDKRRWSELSSSFGTVSGSRSEQTDTEVSKADSRAVVPTMSELEGS